MNVALATAGAGDDLPTAGVVSPQGRTRTRFERRVRAIAAVLHQPSFVSRHLSSQIAKLRKVTPELLFGRLRPGSLGHPRDPQEDAASEASSRHRGLCASQTFDAETPSRPWSGICFRRLDAKCLRRESTRRAREARDMTTVSLIVMEPGSDWPGHVGDCANLVAFSQHGEKLLERTKEKLDTLRRHRQDVRVAVPAFNGETEIDTPPDPAPDAPTPASPPTG